MGCVIVAGILLSVSRAALISTCAGLLTLVLLASRQAGVGWFKPAIFVGLFGLAVGAWLLASPMAGLNLARWAARGRRCSHVALSRCAGMIPEAPAFGTGPATFQYVHPRFQGPECGETRARFTHNDYLNLACDYGLVGVAIVGGYLVCLGRALGRSRLKIERRNDRAL